MNEDSRMDREISNVLRALGLTPELTKASGQARGDGDVIAGPFMVENKYRSTEGFSVSKKDFDKAKKQAAKQGLDLIFCRQNVHGETIVCMDVDTWRRWMSEAMDGKD